MVRLVWAFGFAGTMIACAALAALPPPTPRPLPRSADPFDGGVPAALPPVPVRATSPAPAAAREGTVVSSLPEEVVHGGAPTFGTPGTFAFAVTARDAQRMPGGFGDPTRFLQALPGVSNDSDFDGLLYVRGGEGGHNKILLDHVSVSDAYHFGGVVSVLNTDVMERVEFMPGGYTAEYGDALSGVLKVRRRIGNPVDVRGTASLSILTANGTFEGPLGNDGEGSFLVAARRSYVDQVLRGRSDGQTALPSYWDLDARIWRRVGNQEFRAGLLRSGDALSARLSDSFTFAPAESSGLTWDRQLTLASLEWEPTPRPDGWALSASTAYGWRDQAVHYVSSLPQSAVADTRTFDARFDAKQRTGTLRWATGAQVTHSHSEYALDINRLSVLEPDRRSNPRSPLDTTRVESAHEGRNVYAATYLQTETQFLDSTLAMTLGARLEYSSRSEEMLPTPRLRLAWATPLRGVTATVAAGSYRQFPAERLETDPTIGNPDLGAEHADHLMLGVAKTFERGGRVSVEGYLKRLSNLIVYDPGADEHGGEPFVNAGTGKARGVEFLAHLPRRKFDAWVAYTLGEVKYRDFAEAAEYAPSQDIRHTVSAVARVRPGHGWTFGAKWRAQSGRPYTPVVGRENVSEFVDGVDWIPVLGGYNSGRFPWYQRLDVRAERAFRIGGTNVNASLEAVNVLGRRNLYDYRYLDGYSRAEPVTMLPFLPTFGVTVAF